MSGTKQRSPAEKLQSHLQSKWKDKPCPMCGGKKWSLPPVVFQLQSFQVDRSTVKNDPVLPLIPITCENCGLVQMVNAIIAGVLPPSAPPTKQ